MYKELIEELNHFLIDYRIAGLQIFTAWVLRQAGIKTKYFGKGFTAQSREEISDGCYFDCQGLHPDEIERLSTLFSIPVDHLSQDLKLDYKINLFPLLPKFNDDVHAMTLGELRPYQIDSRTHLLSNAIDRIAKNTKAIIRYLNISSPIELNPEHADLTALLFSLQGLLVNLLARDKSLASTEIENSSIELVTEKARGMVQSRSVADCSKYVLYFHQKVQEFCTSHPNLMQDTKIAQPLENIHQQLIHYIKVSGLDLLSFKNDVHAFFLEYQINTITCGVFEETICRMAGTSYLPKYPDFNWSVVDKTRIQFVLDCMNDSDKDKLREFFLLYGDNTASFFAGDEYKSWGYEAFRNSDGRWVIGQLFDVDAEILVTCILPAMKNYFVSFAMANPDAIRDYQEKSKRPIDYQDATYAEIECSYSKFMDITFLAPPKTTPRQAETSITQHPPI